MREKGKIASVVWLSKTSNSSSQNEGLIKQKQRELVVCLWEAKHLLNEWTVVASYQTKSVGATLPPEWVVVTAAGSAETLCIPAGKQSLCSDCVTGGWSPVPSGGRLGDFVLHVNAISKGKIYSERRVTKIIKISKYESKKLWKYVCDMNASQK